jgi:predicted MFS family arabinose efflux permease
LFFVLFGLICAIANAGNDGLITLHYAEVFKADSMDVGLFGVNRGIGALFGAAGFAFVRARVTAFKAYAGAAVLLGVGCLFSSLPIPPLVAALMWGFCWGFQETSFVTMAMTFAQGKWAATMFATSMIFANLGVSIGEGIGAPLVPRIGYDGVFMVYAAFAWFSLIFLSLTFRFIKKAGHSIN